MRKRIKKAFTILEITIVIVIIGVIMGATMKFGGDRIGFLNNKNLKEQFMSNYNSLYSNNMMSSYHMGDIYDNLELKMNKGEGMINYSYNIYGEVYSGRTYIDGGFYEIENLALNGEGVDELNVVMEPYVLGCKINGIEESVADISILVNKSKPYCFEINSDNCRIYSISCN